MLTKETILQILNAGILAPSGDNLQAWKFRFDKDNNVFVDINNDIDPSLLNVIYKEHKLASIISIGAAIENMRIEAYSLGYEFEIKYFPFPEDNKNCVALIRLIKNNNSLNTPLLKLSPYLQKRCVNRRIYTKKQLPEQIKAQTLANAQKLSPTKIYWLEKDKDLSCLAKIVKLSDKILFEEKELLLPLLETIRWTKKQEEKTCDGMPLKSLELNPILQIALRMFTIWPLVRILNILGLSQIASSTSKKMIKSASSAALVTIPWNDNLKDFIIGGSAMERIWLTLTSFDLAVQPMMSIVFLIIRLNLIQGEGIHPKHIQQIKLAKKELYNLFKIPDNELPVSLFRIGYAAEPSSRAILRKKDNIYENK